MPPSEDFNKKINKMLAIGIFLATCELLVFVIFFSINNDNTEKDKKKFVKLEIASWIFGSLSAIILITSSAYTVVILRRLYGNDFSRTTRFMMVIVSIFVLAFSGRTIYEWVMYFYFRAS